MQRYQGMKKSYYTLQLGIFLSCLFLAGCWVSHSESAKKLLVINVLDPSLYNDAHIKGSVSVPLDKLEQSSRGWAKDTRIIVYCANYMCSASAEAARRLQKLGFTDVFAYEGGTAEWHSKGHPVEGSAKEGYLKNVGQQHTPLPSDVKMMGAEELKNEIERAEQARRLIKNK